MAVELPPILGDTSVGQLVINQDGWNEVVKKVIKEVGVPRMEAVAEACNSEADIENGYRVSTDGGEPLVKQDYRVTVITATWEAMHDNAKNNTLVNNFYQAGGEQ